MSSHDRDPVDAAEPERADGDGAHGDSILARAWTVLEDHWTPYGYCVPNPTTYPWLWLWDSCFHAVAWAALGDARAVTELASCLVDIDEDGFVPHMRYVPDPGFHATFWGRAATSSITQPPMYGHAVAELTRRGMQVPAETVDRAARALRFLLRRRGRSDGGLVAVVHPWETGCDDSPRWDHWRRDADDLREWHARKGTLLDTVERSPAGAPVGNPAFRCAPVGFSALVAWNARELVSVTGDDRLRDDADELAEAVLARWDGTTWVDDGDAAADSGRIPTLDALLPALLGGPRAVDAVSQYVDPTRFGAPFGPAGVSRSSPVYDPARYWRGATWPQLAYLSFLAATRSGSLDVADSVRTMTVSGASSSGWAEYWNPDDGAGLGAVPQSWTSLVAAMLVPT